MTRVAVFCALRWECRAVLRALRGVSRGRMGGRSTWAAQLPNVEVVLLQTGVGPTRAHDAARAVAGSGEFDLFLSAGCAGALTPSLRSGDLVIASSIVGDTGSFDPAPGFGLHAAAACEQRNLPFQSGPVLTSSTVLTTAAARRQAAAHSGAIAVAMEAAAIAAAAAERHIPMAEVRAILDGVEVELHETGDFMDPESGRLRPLAVMRYVAGHPTATVRLLELRRMAAKADKAVGEFFSGYFDPIRARSVGGVAV